MILRRFVGCKVIAKNISDDFYHIGRLLSVSEFSLSAKNTTALPVILSYRDRNRYVIHGVIVLYSEELVKILDDMSFAEQDLYLVPFNLNIVKQGR